MSISNPPFKDIIAQMKAKLPNGYFGVYAGERLFIWDGETETFTASDNPDTRLAADSPLLITELESGLCVCPMVSFRNLDDLLDYLRAADIKQDFCDGVINIIHDIQRDIKTSRLAELN